VYSATHWDTIAGRPSQVSILSPAISQGDPLRLLMRNTVRAAGLFTFQGDAIPRHNVPLRPLFDPLVSVFFILGVFFCLRKRDRACVLSLIWTGVMLLPTILAEDCPHFLRAVGILPMAAVFPALGLEWARGRLAARGYVAVGSLLVGTVLTVSAIWGGVDYFWRHGGDPQELGYYFEADQLREAIEINEFLGTGWQGTGISEPEANLIAGRHVYLGPRMWEGRIAVNFLVASPDRVSILDRDPVTEANQVLALVWPHGDMSAARDVLPSPAEISVQPGPLERGDLDETPSLLYVAFRGDRLQEISSALARFEAGIELLDWRVDATDDGESTVYLRWRTIRKQAKDYTVFVHLERDGTIIAQDDRAPGAGYYPTTWWKPGDEIADTHVLKVPYDPTRHQIWIGWYEPSSMQHLRVLEQDSQPGGTRLRLE